MQSEQFQLHAQIEQRHWWFVARRKIIRQLINELLTPGPEAMILDVGCGTGGNIADLADSYRCVGCDTSAEAIALAKQRFAGAEFVLGEAPEAVADRVSQAGAVTLMDVLEHVPDDFLLLSKLLAAVQPGTHFVVTVPADMRLWGHHDVAFGHFRRYDTRRLTQVWEGLPVTVRMLSYFNSRLYWLIRGIRAKNRLLAKLGRQDVNEMTLPSSFVNRVLHNVFAGEAKHLLRMLKGEANRPYRRGASLLAVIRRENGQIVPRTKPADLPPDRR